MESATTLFQAAAEAWHRRDYLKAIDLLTRGSEQHPANPKILLNLGEAHGLRFDFGEAERCLETAVKVASQKLEALTEAGRRCQRFGQPRMANRFFSRAAELPGVSASVLVTLAEFEEDSSRIESAKAFLERALAIEPGCPPALLVWARLHRMRGELEEGERLLSSMLARATGDTLIGAWYELGTILDRQGDFDQAMAAFLQAKTLLAPGTVQYEAELEALRGEIRRVETAVSSRTFERWVAARAELPPARRFALLCGHPRSGTTLLEQVLDSHPGVVATDESPLLLGEAFPALQRGLAAPASTLAVLESATIDALQQCRNDYFRFAESISGRTIGDRLLIDKNPTLDVHIPIVARIFPEASYLVAIRDPRDVCLSCFMLPLPSGRLSALYLSLEGIAAQYAWVMGVSRAIRSRLPCPQLEVRYEAVVTDLECVSRQVLAFLGLEWNAEVLRFHQHAKQRLLRSAIDGGVARPLFANSVGRWRRYQKYLEPCLEKLAPFIQAFGYD